MNAKSRKCSYSLSICTDMYLLNAKAFSPEHNKSLCKYALSSYLVEDSLTEVTDELHYVIRTDSKSELKVKMAVYGLRFGKRFKLYRSIYGRYAELEVVSVADNLDKSSL